jgi:hypothetical protein
VDRDEWWHYGLVILLCVAMVAAVFCAVVSEHNKQDECRRDGGSVIKLNGSHDEGWFCLYPPERR